jgi:two-component system response regulator YesN
MRGVDELIIPIITDGNYDGQLMFGPLRTASPCYYDDCSDLHQQLNAFTNKELDSISQILKPLIELIKLREKQKIFQLRDTVSNGKIQRAIEYINKNINKHLSASDVAENSFLSTSRFLHLFKETCHLTFTDYITKQKIEKAKKLLVDTHLSISEISYKCGFSSQSYFGSIFRKTTTLSPSQYRQMYQIVDKV